MKKKLLPLVVLASLLIGNNAYGSNLVWAKSLNAKGTFASSTILKTAFATDGNLLVLTGGYNIDTLDVDLGSGFSNVATSNYIDYTLVKYNTDGTLIWSKTWSGAGSAYAGMSTFIVRPSDGHIFLYGYYDDAIDADPGAAVVSLNGSAGRSLMLIETDENGQYVWAGAMSSVSGTRPSDIAFNSFGYVIITGEFTGGIDLDPSTTAYTLNSTTTNGTESFVAMYNTSHQIVFGWSYSNSFGSSANYLSVDVNLANNDLYISGDLNGTVDADVKTSGVANMVSAGDHDGFIARYDYLGNYINHMTLGGTGYDAISRLNFVNGELLFVTTTNGSLDVDAGAGTYTLIGNGNFSFHDCLTRYTSTFGFTWAADFNSTTNKTRINGLETIGSKLYCIVYNDTTFDADPNAGIVNVVLSNYSTAVVVLDYGSGNYLEHFNFTASGARAIAQGVLPQNNTMYVYGSFVNGFDADLNSGTEILNNPFWVTGEQYLNTFIGEYDFLEVEPTVQVSNLHFTAGTDTTVTVNFTMGNGTKRLVVVSKDAPVTDLPDDAMFYYNDTVYGNGQMLANGAYAVYLNTGETFTLTGIDTTGGHMYYFKAFEMSGISSTINFLTDNAPTATYGGNTSTGIEEKEKLQVALYPNPVKDFLNLRFENNNEETKVRIFNTQGSIIAETTVLLNTVQLDISKCSSGMYFVEIQSGYKKSVSKFIKE